MEAEVLPGVCPSVNEEEVALVVNSCDGADPKLYSPAVGWVELAAKVDPTFDVPVEAEVLPCVSPSVNADEVAFVVKLPNLKPVG